MDQIAAIVAERGWTQNEAATHCAVTQPRMNDLMRRKRRRKRGRCGLAMSRNLVGANPTWVIVSREPSIEPCGTHGNGRVDV